MKEDIQILLAREESPTLEFKREWYWNDQTPPEEMAEKWGELIKDLISLANGYIGKSGDYRYLIIGFSEEEKKIYSIKTEELFKSKNTAAFKKYIIEKLEKYTRPSIIDFELNIISVESQSLMVFEIPCPLSVIETKGQLKTKTRHLDDGMILVRKGQKSDEVRVATPSEIEDLKNEFSKYKESELYKKHNPEELPYIAERSIEKTIQLFIDKNAMFTLSDGFPVKEKNWKENIVYEVYRLEDKFSGFREFIYIHDSSNQGKTIADIKKKQLIKNFSSSIVLIDKPKIRDIERRKNNIKKIFSTEFVFSIDEFGYEHLYKECILPYEKFNLPVYVDGLYDEEGNHDLSAIERLKSWFNRENEPLLVVSGHGGIGKTTLAKQFLDYVSDENPDAGILFIDSKEIISELSRNFSVENKVSDVFDFYKALMDVSENDCARFDKDLLQLSIDNGSLVVVLDGIDEVIAKIGEKFDVTQFITSIVDEYSSGLHKGKLLITCRDHFWNEVGKNILLPEITLKAFSSDLAIDFFQQKLDKDPKKVKRALDIADKLAIESTSPTTDEKHKTYIPFLLDMIGYLIKSGDFTDGANILFDSKYLFKNSNTDKLIAQLCRREIVKLGGFSIDQQIELFIRVAANKQNGISFYDIKEEMQKIKKITDNKVIDNIKGHTLLLCSNNTIYFRYDVFETYFKGLLVYSFFKEKDIKNLNEDIVRIISGYLKYESSFTESISEKIDLDDDLIIFCIEVIEHARNMDLIPKEKFISSIFSFLLNLLQNKNGHQSNIESRTKLLEQIFGENGKLVGVCLVDIFGSSSFKPTFNFSGKELVSCTFNNYEYFWECTMNEETIFHESTFKGIDPRSGINYKIHKGIFGSSCDTTAINHLLSEKQQELENTEDAIKSELDKVFKLFYQRGNFYPRKKEEVRKKLSAVKLLPRLMDIGVIKNYNDPKKPTLRQYKVCETYKSVIDYIEQGNPSKELQTLIKELA